MPRQIGPKRQQHHQARRMGEAAQAAQWPQGFEALAAQGTAQDLLIKGYDLAVITRRRPVRTKCRLEVLAVLEA